MPDPQMPPWAKYSLALVIAVLAGAISELPDLDLPSPMDAGWSPTVSLTRAVVVGVAFSLIIVTGSILFRSQVRGRQNIFRSGVFAFLLFGGCQFAAECVARPFFAGLSKHIGFEGALIQIVTAGRGQLPLLLLAVFITFVLIKTRRTE